MNAMPILAPIRPEVLAIETQQIMQVSTLAMDDPEVIAMWYGASDITAPEFICDAAASALRRGRPFIPISGVFRGCVRRWRYIRVASTAQRLRRIE